MYQYADERKKVFTEDGQVMLLKIRDKMRENCNLSGAVSFCHATIGITGDSWIMLACIDRLVELGEFECIFSKGMTQDRVYRRT